MKDKVSGISKKGMEGIFGNMKLGETNGASKFDMFTLTKRGKVAEVRNLEVMNTTG